jgi:hypothetical protein
MTLSRKLTDTLMHPAKFDELKDTLPVTSLECAYAMCTFVKSLKTVSVCRSILYLLSLLLIISIFFFMHRRRLTVVCHPSPLV